MKKLTHDEKVYRRWAIVEALGEAVNTYDKELLKSVLHRISRTPDFEVVLNCKEDVYICGRKYGNGDKTIMIKESGHRMFVIYKDIEHDRTSIDYSQYDMQTEAEDKAESDWEREAESAYERHLDYKAFMADLGTPPQYH